MCSGRSIVLFVRCLLVCKAEMEVFPLIVREDQEVYDVLSSLDPCEDFENTRNKPLIPPMTVQYVPKIPHQDGLSGVSLCEYQPVSSLGRCPILLSHFLSYLSWPSCAVNRQLRCSLRSFCPCCSNEQDDQSGLLLASAILVCSPIFRPVTTAPRPCWPSS